MPVTINHALTATTPDNTSYEIRPSNWNSAHVASLSAVGSEVIGAFSNSNNVSFGLGGGGAITASASYPAQTVQTQAAGNIAGNGVTTVTQAGSTLGVTQGTNGLSLAVPAWVTTAAAGGVDVTLGGNTAGVLALVSTGTLFLAGGNNVTLSQNGNSVTISANTAAAANLSVSGGTTSGAFGGLTFANANNVSFGLNNGTISASASYPAQTVQTQAAGNIAGTNTAVSGNVSVTLNSNGLSLNASNLGGTGFATTTSAGTAIAGTNNTAGFTLGVPPFLTTQTVQTQASGNIAGTGVTTTTQAGTTLGVTQNTAGLSLAIPAWITTAAGGGIDVTLGGNTAGVLALVNTGTLFLAGGNNVTLSQNGNSVTISANTAAAANLSVSAGTTSGAFGGLTFANANNVSFGLNNGTISASASQSVQTQAAGNIAGTNANLAVTNFNATFNANTAGISLSLSLPGGSIGVSNIGNTSGSTGVNSGQVVFAGGNNVTLSVSSNVFGNQTITISGAAGGAVALQSRQDFWPAGAYSANALTQGSASLRYIQLEQPVTFSRVDVPALISLGTVGAPNTANLLISSGLVLYSRNGSTLSPIAGAFGSTTYTWASNSSNYSSLTGGKNISFPIGTSLSAGEYWVGFQLSTNNNSSIGTATTQLSNTIYLPYGVIDVVDQYGDFGNTYGASQNLSTMGVFSNSITATNQTLAMAALTATGTALQGANFPVIFRNY